VTGKVTDEKGEGVANVSVSVQGSTRVVLTGADGTFIISASKGQTLQFSSVGYKGTTMVLGDDPLVNVSLITEIAAMTDVVVVGYSTQRKVTVTGAVSAVKGDVLVKSPAIDMTNSLAGRLPGLVVIQQSGEPGYDGAVMRIRGANTLGNSSPRCASTRPQQFQEPARRLHLHPAPGPPFRRLDVNAPLADLPVLVHVCGRPGLIDRNFAGSERECQDG